MGVLSKWKAKREAKKKAKQTTATSTTGNIYSGPVPSGATESVFRETGTTDVSISSGGGGKSYSGPVKPGTDVETFRETGVSTPTSDGLYSGPVKPGTAAETFRQKGISIPIKKEKQKEIIVQKGGGVKVENVEYIGEAVVPYSQGKTANQIRAEMEREARARGLPSGRGRFTARIPIAQREETFEQKQSAAMDMLVGGGGGDNQSRILLPNEENSTLYPQPDLTASEIERIKLQEISERQQLPFGERIQTAYRSADGKATWEDPISIRGYVRAFLEGSAYAGEKVGIVPTGDDIFIKKGLLYKPVSSRVAEDIIISAALLGGTTSTTAQLERQIASLTKVNILGVSQRVGKGGVATDVRFAASRGGTDVKGSAFALSKEVGRSSKGSIYLTALRGKLFKTRIHFPSGKIVSKGGKSFTTADITGIVKRGDYYISKGYGFSQAGTKTSPFGSAGIGKNINKDLMKQFGASVSKEGNIFSRSIIKLKDKPFTNLFKITGGGKKPAKFTGQITQESSLKAITNSVNSAVRSSASSFLPPKTITRLIPVTDLKSITSQASIPSSSYAGTGMYERTTGGLTPGLNSLQKLNQYTSDLTKTYTPLKSAIFIQERQRGKTRTGTRQIFYEDLATRQVPKITQIYKQTPIQKTKLTSLYTQVQATRGIARPFIFPRIQVRPKIKAKAAFKIKPYRQPKLYPGGYAGQVRRFGVFKTIGKGSLKDVFGLSTRKVKKELGATFRIIGPKGKPIKQLPIPKGFYQKQSKKFGTLFIEKKSQRIKKVPKSLEVKELAFYRGIKNPIRSRKKKKKGIFDIY